MRVYFLHPPFVSNGKTLSKFLRLLEIAGNFCHSQACRYPIWLSHTAEILDDAGHNRCFFRRLKRSLLPVCVKAFRNVPGLYFVTYNHIINNINENRLII